MTNGEIKITLVASELEQSEIELELEQMENNAKMLFTLY